MNMHDIAYHRIAVEHLRHQEIALPRKLFGDGPIVRHTVGAETASSAFSVNRADRAHGRLLAMVREIDGRDAVVARLAACMPAQICLHALCPKCERVIGRWLAWTAPTAVRKILKARVDAPDMNWSSHCRTVIISASRMRAGDCKTAQEIYSGIVNRFHDALHDAGVSTAIGGITFAGIQDAANNDELEFVVKLRAVVFCGESEVTTPIPTKSRFGPVRSALKEKIDWHFGRQGGRRIQSLLRGSRWSNDQDEMMRLLQSDLRINEVIWGHRKPNGSRKPARYHSRSIWQHEVETLVSLTSRFNVTDRLFLHGLTISANERGRMVLRPLPETLQPRRCDPIDCRVPWAKRHPGQGWSSMDNFADLDI